MATARFLFLQAMQIIFEDDVMLVINKPAGLQVERDKWGYESVQEQAEKYLSPTKKHPFVGIVHRIDRPVSGVLLLAKKKSALLKLNEQFREKKVKKLYYGVVHNKPQKHADTLTHWIKRDEVNKKAIVTVKKSAGSFYCELKYETVAEKNGKYLLKIEPITGKFHQIRAQLSFIHCPIAGDSRYGSEISYKQNAICLHSYSVDCLHPVKNEEMILSCDIPEAGLWKF